MVFLDVLAGWPGSVHDSRILRNSYLFHTAANKFPGDKHLLGDGGYPLLRSVYCWLAHTTGHYSSQCRSKC